MSFSGILGIAIGLAFCGLVDYIVGEKSERMAAIIKLSVVFLTAVLIVILGITGVIDFED